MNLRPVNQSGVALLAAIALYLPFALGFEIPKGVGNISELDEIAASAAKNAKPMAFVITKKSLTPT